LLEARELAEDAIADINCMDGDHNAFIETDDGLLHIKNCIPEEGG